MHNHNYIRKIIFDSLIVFLLFIYFPFHLNFQILNLLTVLLITFISDNIDVKWKNNSRLVSNVPGFLVAYLHGPQYIFAASLITLFRLNERNYLKRIRKFLVYFFMYYGSYIIVNFFDLNIYMKLFLYISLSKILNSLLVDITKFDIKLFAIEYVFFIASLPSIYLHLLSQNTIVKYYFLSQNLIFLGIYYFITKYLYEKEEEKIKNKRLNRFNEIMLEFSNLLYSYSIKASKEFILNEAAKFLNKKFGYKYVLISEIDYANDIIKRISYAGFSKEEFEKLKNRKVYASEIINEVFKNDYRYGEVYFIPNMAEKLNKNDYFIFEQNINANNIKNKDYMWNKNDLLAIALKNKNNDLIGYISCDSPENGLRPTREDMQILSVLAKIVSMILVHGEHFKEIKKMSETDYLTGLYNSSKLNKDLQMYEREKNLISLAFIDLDNFKKINDKYGHLKGDSLLKEFSNILKNSIRSNDKAYRYGGDEFIIIFEGINKFEARNIIKRIKKNLTRTGLKFSVGIEDNNKTNINILIKNADKKAYTAKNKGKNKIIY
ncbi:GGDEF domain-containing protein [Marinitoga aeolica]|uniref:GGDEF domain-containing protein n=1 Tax=Marinitoga aeolica TaxID=2809031 RepID=A0ABY8PSS7_9BACT|nr:GGDEF domain-containing protein [Marinitoga aeolica]WGS65696.1 GGDEF domain-containing protein [Marinitoga aeolica]